MTVAVAVVGAGFSGIGVAIALRRAGIEDLVVLEAGDGVGGAWHWNRYPGVAVDIPSFSYQFSYAQRTDWSRVYAPGDELKAYAEDLVDAQGLRSRIRLRTRVVSATWDDERHHWTLAIEDGAPLVARFVVGATGIFSQPRPPEVPGLDAFAGTTMHTARWDGGVDLAGKRVGVIGTGASAVQLIPAIAPSVEQLTVFQRTPVWCLPKLDGAIGPRARVALDRVPGLRAAARGASQALVEATFPLPLHYADVFPFTRVGERLVRRQIRRDVADPATRERLTPRYSLGCKRPTFHNHYYRSFARPNVALVTDRIDTVTPAGIRSADGAEHPLDVLVLATGFKVFDSDNLPPYPVTGRDGLDLAAFWAEHRLQAYEGVSVPGFPNSFGILGPYGFNGASYFTLIENQSRHIVRCLRRARELGATRVEVTPEANRRYFERQLARRPRQIFFRGACEGANSYYFDAHGDAPFRAATTLETAWRSARFPLSDYRFDAVGDRAAPSPMPVTA